MWAFQSEGMRKNKSTYMVAEGVSIAMAIYISNFSEVFVTGPMFF
jgi:hypothetical protein